MICEECGKEFDPTKLEEVIYHIVHTPIPMPEYMEGKKIER